MASSKGSGLDMSEAVSWCIIGNKGIMGGSATWVPLPNQATNQGISHDMVESESEQMDRKDALETLPSGPPIKIPNAQNQT